MKKNDCHKKGTSHRSQQNQLKRIEGQVRGINNMIEEDRYCIDILTQLKAIRSSLKSVEKKIFKQHLDHCVKEAVQSKDAKRSEEVVEEIYALLGSLEL